MKADVLSGKWKQLKGEIKRRWGRLTDDDITEVEGEWDKLVGKLQERYGYEREQVEREIEDLCAGAEKPPRR